jgi:hypothetical protein
VLLTRPTWTRGLTLCGPPPHTPTTGARDDPHVAIRSWFRSLVDPRRFACYCVEEAVAGSRSAGPEHTLLVVREFRRVPLLASSLALTVFRARPGHAAPVVAALAHFAERAISLYQPSYLLLARSLEQPGMAILVTGVHEGEALQAAGPAAFSLDRLLPELAPMLAADPEHYAYHRDAAIGGLASLVSPRAV